MAAAPDALLRAGLLDAQVIALSAAESGLGAAAAAGCAALGAIVEPCPSGPDDEAGAERAAAAVLERHGRIDTLLVDADATFATGGEGIAPLRAAVDSAWLVTRAVANAAMIPGERGGKVVYVAPAPGRGAHAHAARAALENMARTLSIEWSRYAIRLTAIAPGDASDPREVATLAAYLASPAGDYFSGCLLSLDVVG